MRVGSSFNHEHWGARGYTGEVTMPFFLLCSTPTPLTPTHPFISLPSTLSIPSLFLLCLIPRSLLTSSSSSSPPHLLTLPSLWVAFYTPWPFLPPPFPLSPRLPPFIQAFIKPQHISTFASTFPRSRRFIIPLLPLSLAPSTLSAPLYHGPTSIPPFHSCQLSEPQKS